ncbi:hypothetical protein EYF80_043610 [Liparis tanakae]|uniref:Uncharacterized protein n=1 Tax=Liparis tanakae TaxID=230148 RepID=A0A4Z2FYW5_9TELE|nr:hypothetical protein EYF80_043610 [Liparis tanakae]
MRLSNTVPDEALGGGFDLPGDDPAAVDNVLPVDGLGQLCPLVLARLPEPRAGEPEIEKVRAPFLAEEVSEELDALLVVQERVKRLGPLQEEEEEEEEEEEGSGGSGEVQAPVLIPVHSWMDSSSIVVLQLPRSTSSGAGTLVSAANGEIRNRRGFSGANVDGFRRERVRSVRTGREKRADGKMMESKKPNQGQNQA